MNTAPYADLGVDVEKAIATALQVPISLHCWQSDDVAGLETKSGPTDGGGILATGNYPGRARNGDEIRQDVDKVLSLLPGRHRFNLHACYAETGKQAVDRDAFEPAHFARWMDWAKRRKIALDFNPTYFAHPKAAGFTLSHQEPEIRDFWIRHGIASRRIAAAMGKAQGSPAVNNQWIPDGLKDSPADRWSPRARLIDSYDRIFAADLGADAKWCIDAVEPKLFGLGSEDYVVGSFEFYLGYTQTRNKVLCLDMGHFHPTETITDKLAAILQFQDKVLLHTSRPIRWDSDHVVVFNDDLRAAFTELARGNALDRAYIALDFFDASINRIAAYVIGARATRKAILQALLDPTARLRALETQGKIGFKLALMERVKTLPFGEVWDELCRRAEVPSEADWVKSVESYERRVLAKRS